MGIVSKFKEAGLDEYHYGLWWKDILLHLLWELDAKPSRTAFIDDIVFSAEPSWSWSPIPYPVKWAIPEPDPGETERATVVEVTPDGRLLLEGPLTEATLDLTSKKLWKSGVDLGYIGETWLDDPAAASGRRECDFKPDMGEVLQDTRKRLTQDQSLTLLLVVEHQDGERGQMYRRGNETFNFSQPVTIWTALVLARSKKTRGAFVRVGLARGKHVNYGNKKLSWFAGIERTKIKLV